MDTIGDFLTIIRNAIAGRLPVCEMRASRMKVAILEILRSGGYIKSFEKYKLDNGVERLRIFLKYVNGASPIVTIRRCSRPGCRRYFAARSMPRALGGLGLSIVSTSRGVMDNLRARKLGVGGELLCQVW